MSTTRLESLFSRRCVMGCTLVAWFAFQAAITHAQINVLTERYDQSRLGANLNETQLTTSNVNATSFGKLWSYPVSGSVHAQPLYVRNVTIAGKGTHNVLYVATMNDILYAFDADSSSSVPLLSLDLTHEVAGSTPVPVSDIVGPGLNITGNVGILSTPQIDLTTNTLYLVARTKEPGSNCGSVNGNYCQRLHALDITTFAEKFGGPVVIQGSVSGTGTNSQNGTLVFDPKIHNQRSSLALANGQIYIAWASHEDQNPYHGWVMSYSASTLKQTGIWSSSPDGSEGGVWMGGWGPAVDASNNVYYIVGNGDWNGTRNFGESIVKFGASSGMPLLDWFTPDNWSSLNAGDVDLGSTGAMLIPGTDLLIGTGKQSLFYITHTGNLGHEQTGNGQIVQSFSNHSGEIKGGPVYWNRSGGTGPWMYVWANGCDYLKAYHFNGSTFDTGVVSESTVQAPCGASGGVLALSANGSAPGSGIVWSSMPLADDGDHGVHAGILRALNADDLTKELWNSRLNASRDDSGNWPKFSPPTVVNGRVYLASFPADGVGNGAINVFGLLPAAPPATGTGAISIDFVGRGTAMASAEVAGIVAKSNWNDALGATGTGLALHDETGASSGAIVSWTSSPVWSLNIPDNPGNFRMMNGYLDTVGQNTTVNVSGLPPNSAGYDVYVYVAGDNGSGNRTGTYQLSGSGIATTSFNLTDPAYTNFNGTFTNGTNATGNYVLFPAVNASAFTLTAIPGAASDGTQRAPVNGIQIVPHVAPAGTPIGHSSWTLKYADSQETTGENGAAANAFDGNLNSFWHTQWYGANPAPPHEIQINLGGTYSLSSFSYLPRQDGCTHGDINQYEFYVSTDGSNWGSPIASGNFTYGDNYVYACTHAAGTSVPAHVITFPAVSANYVRLRALSEMGGNPWTSAAEINVFQ